MAAYQRHVLHNNYFELLRQNRLPRVFNRNVNINDLSDEKLRQRYRFSRDSLRYIAALIEDDIRPLTNRNHAISAEEQLLVALRFYASGSFLQVIGDTFGYDKATVSRIVRRVSLALAEKRDNFIKFPTTVAEKRVIRDGLYELGGFPGVIGLVDGTHVRILAPTNNEANFVNRKGYHSINVQVVCDHKGQ